MNNPSPERPADDGRAYTVSLRLGASLEVHTIIDHVGIANAEAWLEAPTASHAEAVPTYHRRRCARTRTT